MTHFNWVYRSAQTRRNGKRSKSHIWQMRDEWSKWKAFINPENLGCRHFVTSVISPPWWMWIMQLCLEWVMSVSYSTAACCEKILPACASTSALKPLENQLWCQYYGLCRQMFDIVLYYACVWMTRGVLYMVGGNIRMFVCVWLSTLTLSTSLSHFRMVHHINTHANTHTHTQFDITLTPMSCKS